VPSTFPDDFTGWLAEFVQQSTQSFLAATEIIGFSLELPETLETLGSCHFLVLVGVE
jgi:hypothetical protein